MALRKNKIIYLDYAATTPVLPEVLAVMQPYFYENFGNPGSIHKMGQVAQKAVDDARESVKSFVGAYSLREIIFTGSATEANNLAIFGVIRTANLIPGIEIKKDRHILTTAIEHESILEPCRALEKQGFAEITYLKPNSEGLISPEQIRDALRPETILVSIGYANNEIGVIQPVAKIADVIRDFSQHLASSSKKLATSNWQLASSKPSPVASSQRLEAVTLQPEARSQKPLFHTDAAQAAQFLDMNVEQLGVDFMTLSAHKLYGPKGIGALFVKDEIKLNPILYGGGQEYGLRSSTPNVPLIAGFAKALEVTKNWKLDGGPEKILQLRDYLLESISNKITGAVLNGSRSSRLPNIVNVCLGEKIDGEALLISLSEEDICVSSGAACSSRSQKPSHVIQAIGKNVREASASLRISLGRNTSGEELDEFTEILAKKLKMT